MADSYSDNEWIVKEHGGSMGVRKDDLDRSTRTPYDNESIINEHGGSMGVRKDDLDRPTRTPYDNESIINEHGGSMGVRKDWLDRPTRTPYDNESIINEHGGSMGVVTDEAREKMKMERYRISDDEEIKLIAKLSKADKIDDVSEIIPQLSDEGIKTLIERRLRESFYLIQGRAGINAIQNNLPGRLSDDFSIIKVASDLGVDLSSEDINVAITLGKEDYRDIDGILQEYYNQLFANNLSEMVVVDPVTQQASTVTDAMQILDNSVKEKVMENSDFNSVSRR